METGASPKLCFTQAKLEKMMLDLNKILTRAVEDLKQQLRPPAGMPARRGVFDTLKNWWGNLRHGFQSPNNPYYHQNVMGHLGKPVAEMSLSEYKYLFEKAKILEENVLLIERKLQLDVELDRWLANLKSDLSSYFGAKLSQLAMQTQKKTEKEAAKKLEKELKQKIPLAAGDFEKSFFDKYRLPKKDDELLGLPPEISKPEQRPAEEPATDVARTPLDPEAAEKIQRRIINFTGKGEGDKKRGKGGKRGKGDTIVKDKTVVNPAEVVPEPVINTVAVDGDTGKAPEVTPQSVIMASSPKIQSGPKKVQNKLSPKASQTSPPAGQINAGPAVTQALVEPKVRKGNGGGKTSPVGKERPSAGGDFFGDSTNYKNLQLDGLTLYEKTLVCLEKLRS